MKLSITYNDKAVSAKIQKVLKENENEVRNILMKCLMRIEGKAKIFCPVDTGRLRSSLTSKVGKVGNSLIGRVGTNVNYAGAVEYGSGRHLTYVGQWASRHGFSSNVKFLYVSGKPIPFLRPAFVESKDSVLNDFKNSIKKFFTGKS